MFVVKFTDCYTAEGSGRSSNLLNKETTQNRQGGASSSSQGSARSSNWQKDCAGSRSACRSDSSLPMKDMWLQLNV